MSQPARDAGFTLVELLVTIALMGMLMAIAVGSWDRWARADEQSGTAKELQSVLRSTQQRAVTEGVSMCVSFTTTSYTVWRGTCGAEKVQGPIHANGKAQLSTPVFTPLSAAQSAATAVFTPRGTASEGQVHVTRLNSTKDYRISVDGFTGRVSLCDESGCDGAPH